ncbi:hypothetical protein G4X40_09070 [Rhodococcus sp. D2-41]|uniref:Uncharacterized protein n=1 Tax=Speluncibacter jeojiensis TaxID=2710754 RepID=A0A9X4RI66_9ACTN|nr:hypothetical protein [Rhodococcus sp. D2-41]MDG3010303.1 hypothetical protein [Rhodococcus sp. D2-41]MDG3015816.1 hypothetical protein [Corynebacteriales bacterium D3-21]
MLQGEELSDRLLTPPVRVAVCGRIGVGRSTLIGALAPRLAAAGVAAELVETPATNDPATNDPVGARAVDDCEVVLYVLTDRVLDSDRRWLSGLGDRLSLVVLNKADTLPAGLPAGLSALPGPVLPTVAGLGRASVDAAALSPEDRALLHAIAEAGEMPVDAQHFVSAGSEQEQAGRRSLLERWDLYGIGCVVSALRSWGSGSGGAGSAWAGDDAALFARMSQWSGVDAVVSRLAVLADRARSLRVDRQLRELDAEAATGTRRDAIERLLATEAAGLRVATVLDRRHEPRTSGAAVEIAGRWRERAHAATDTSAWRAAMDQHRRYAALAVRLRARETAPGA